LKLTADNSLVTIMHIQSIRKTKVQLITYHKLVYCTQNSELITAAHNKHGVICSPSALC